MDILKILFCLFFSLSANAAYVSDLNILINGNNPAVTNPLGVRLSDGVDYLTAFDLDNTGGVSKILGVSIRTLSNGTPVEFGNGANPFRVDPTGTTIQPVNGTVTANLGTLNGAATASIQTDGTQKARITDGTNDVAVKNTAPSGSDYGLIVRPVTVELPTFSLVATAVTVGNNKSMLAIKNTGTSVVRIREVWIINDQTTAVTGVAGIFQVRSIASFTGGTAVTAVSFDSADTLPGGISAATGATVATETSILREGKWSTDEWGPGTADTESFDHAIQNTRPFWEQTPNGKAITIRQNQGVHIKFATNSTAGAFNVRLIFTVE